MADEWYISAVKRIEWQPGGFHYVGQQECAVGKCLRGRQGNTCWGFLPAPKHISTTDKATISILSSACIMQIKPWLDDAYLRMTHWAARKWLLAHTCPSEEIRKQWLIIINTRLFFFLLSCIESIHRGGGVCRVSSTLQRFKCPVSTIWLKVWFYIGKSFTSGP